MLTKKHAAGGDTQNLWSGNVDLQFYFGYIWLAFVEPSHEMDIESFPANRFHENSGSSNIKGKCRNLK